MSNIHINPFALTTTRLTWNDRNKNFIHKSFNTLKAAVYDITFKNPYELTIGNLKNFDNISKLKKVALAIFIFIATMYTLMLYGGLIYFSGTVTQIFGTNLNAKILIDVGLKIKTFGEKIFLFGSVPTYISFSIVPDKIARLATSTLKKFVKNFFYKILVPSWENLLKPLVSKICSNLKISVCKIFSIYKIVISNIYDITQFMLKNIIIPLASKISHLTKIALNKIQANLKILVDKITTTYQFVITKIHEIIKLILETIIYPLSNKTSYLIKTYSDKLQTNLKNLANKTANNYKLVINGLDKTIESVKNKLTNIIFETTKAAKNISKKLQIMS
jgi:hypothetical protein